MRTTGRQVNTKEKLKTATDTKTENTDILSAKTAKLV